MSPIIYFSLLFFFAHEVSSDACSICGAPDQLGYLVNNFGGRTGILEFIYFVDPVTGNCVANWTCLPEPPHAGAVDATGNDPAFICTFTGTEAPYLDIAWTINGKHFNYIGCFTDETVNDVSECANLE